MTFNLKIQSITDVEKLNLTEINTSDLKLLLVKSIEVTAKYIALLGKVWLELEKRGEDLSEYRQGLLTYLPLVGHGQLDPNLMMKLIGQKYLLREIALFPISEQQRFLNNEKVVIITTNSKGEHERKYVDITEIHPRHYSQVFNIGKLRSEEEQILYLNQQRQKIISSKPRQKNVKYDKNSENLIYGKTHIPFDKVLKALSEISNKSLDEVKDFLKM